MIKSSGCIGNKSLIVLSEEYKVSLDTLLQKRIRNGARAEAKETIKEIAYKNHLNPAEIIGCLKQITLLP